MRRVLLIPILSALLTGCASTNVPMVEPRRLVGTENGIRLDAYIRTEIVTENSAIPVTWDVTNERSTPIAVADMIPEGSYDIESRTITVGLGSEVPGVNLLPRLIVIAPGEKQSFSGAVRVRIPRALSTDPTAPPLPHLLQLKLSFLNDVSPFVQLTSLSEKAVNDPRLADQLFPKWVEHNEAVFTNAVPLRWRDQAAADVVAPARRR